jgi:hypothetical protein
MYNIKRNTNPSTKSDFDLYMDEFLVTAPQKEISGVRLEFRRTGFKGA